MNLRSAIFWFKDTFLGNQLIRKNLESVKKYTDEGVDNYDQLNVIVKWVKQEVPFYKQYRDMEFSQFPIVNKKIIREQFDNFRANFFLNESLHSESTSGSTGTPFTIYQDDEKRLRAAADSLFFSEMADFKLGTKLYYVRVWNKMNKKTFFQCKMKNIVMQDSSLLTDSNIEKFLRRLESDKSEKSILVYANTLTALYRWMCSTGRKSNAKIASIITMSESLPLEVKNGMQEIFNCPVVSRYSNQECGLISQQRFDGDEYVINTGSFFVEILKLDSDGIAEEGELGRIIVTDLYNKAMPMIRYDTGDLGVMTYVTKNGKKGKFLAKIEGRSNDFLFSTKGELLSPVTISVNMWKFIELKQYQFIQTGKTNFKIKIVCDSNPYTRESELIADIKNLVGKEANIDLIYEENIPLLKSGKRKYVINEMQKN
ncbi:MAG: hypothetical protein SPF43_00400 [Bacteroidales bacterium]|nr:hypothetical protein [Bacteroidales bacterium]